MFKFFSGINDKYMSDRWNKLQWTKQSLKKHGVWWTCLSPLTFSVVQGVSKHTEAAVRLWDGERGHGSCNISNTLL